MHRVAYLLITFNRNGFGDIWQIYDINPLFWPYDQTGYT